MSLNPAHVLTKSEVAYQVLLQAIRCGELAPGQRVILATLAEQLQMSLTPVRDALALLAEQGLVVRRPNHMTVICEHTQERSAEVSMLRAVLEPEAAMLAAIRADPADVREIASACEAMESALRASRSDGPGDLTARFHLAVARASGSEILADFVGRMWKQIPIEGLTLTGRLPHAAREHRAILAAVAAHDGGKARRLMSDHVGHAAAATESYLLQLQRARRPAASDAPVPGTG